MPIYEYLCTACEHEFEREQRISEDPIRKCPKCGKLKVKRLISRTSFVLKGGGWYGDLYASQKPPGDKKPEPEAGASANRGDASEASTAKADGAAAPEAKSDPKPEKKGKSKKAAA